MDVGYKVEVEEEVAILAEEEVNKTTKKHTNLQGFIVNLLLKVKSIPMKIGIIWAVNSIMQCIKRICKIYGLIATLHHQDLVSMTKDGISSTHT